MQGRLSCNPVLCSKFGIYHDWNQSPICIKSQLKCCIRGQIFMDTQILHHHQLSGTLTSVGTKERDRSIGQKAPRHATAALP